MRRGTRTGGGCERQARRGCFCRALLAIIAVAPTAACSAGAPATASSPKAPKLMQMPAALVRGNYRIEASGVAWAPSLDRFLVVSDDTMNGANKHLPAVFGMSPQGALDSTPIMILGVTELNDAESICAGPDGTFFLTTSHSLNTKGKSSASRRMLLHLSLKGRELSVEGHPLDLTTATDADGRGLLGIAGLDPAGSLDIEGLTWSHGALYIGLKSPLTARGSAVILRFDHPLDAFKSGIIPSGAISRFREVALPVGHGGGSIHRGVAELLFLPDGSLIVLANAPKGLPADNGGGVFWLRPGATSATMLREFPGFKPEGVALSKDGHNLVVVFDTGNDPPRWTQMPLPH